MTKWIDDFFRKNLWAIGVAVVSLIIWGVTLQLSVTAFAQDMDDLTDREIKNKMSFSTMVESVQDMKETLIKIETNQQHIMRELQITVD